ncbi:MAG: hypothetical protein LAP87_13635 [Acidobacteriia bacterium]|nr:hypothetical protein [Terriglobia bacterium]
MTPEDLGQIRAIVTESEARRGARLERAVTESEARMSARLERAVEALTTSLSDLRLELTVRLERIERRVERTEINMSAFLMTTAAH